MQKIKAIEFIKPLLLLVVDGYAEARGIIEQRVNVENLKSKMLETKSGLRLELEYIINTPLYLLFVNHCQLGLLHLKQDGLKYFFKLEIENIRLCFHHTQNPL